MNMKTIEQRIEELEKELKSIKNDISTDTLYNPSVNLMSFPELETTFSSPFDYPKYPEILGSWDQPINLNDDKEINEVPKTKLEKKIENTFGKILYKFPVYHHQWEMDGYGFIVDDGKCYKKVIMTNHGEPYISSFRELRKKIEEYMGVINKTEKAMEHYYKI